MELITGISKGPHITPIHDAMIHESMVGKESVIFKSFSGFKLEFTANNSFNILDGIGMIQGRMFCIMPGKYKHIDVDVTGRNEARYDIVTARFKELSDGTQTIDLTVIKGTPNDRQSAYEQVVKGDLNNGEKIADFPLYEIWAENGRIIKATELFALQNGLSTGEEKDTGWQSITLSTNWKRLDGEYCVYRKIGNLVEIRFNVVALNDINTSTEAKQIASGLPADCQPKGFLVRTVGIGQGKPFTVYVYEGDRPGDSGFIRFRNKENPKLGAGYALTGQVVYTV